MSFSRTKPGNWTVNDELTSAQINDIDTKTANAVDKTSAGDTISGVLSMSGAGRIRPSLVAGADANATYTVGGGNNVIRVPSTLTADRQYTLSATGASDGDTIEVYCDDALTFVVTILDGVTPLAYMSGVGTAGAVVTHQAATFVRRGSSWHVQAGARNPGLRRTTFTSSGTWTCPPGLYQVLLVGWGGGGGGGGGDNNGAPRAGGGGGGASASAHSLVSVTPGTSYTVTIGAGGTAGIGSGPVGTPASTSGGAGGSTSFSGGGITVTFPGATGGAKGDALANSGTGGAGGSFASTGLWAGGAGGNGGASPTSGGTGAAVPAARGAGGAGGGTVGGGGGAAGPGGAGGAGGTGNVNPGGPGGDAGANTGAGGGGGGGHDGVFGSSSGAGGAGGSGCLHIIWS